MIFKFLPFLLLSMLLGGCATVFQGNPHTNRSICEKKCEAWNMDLSGMVAMGEYSSGCICSKKDKTTSKSEPLQNSVSAVSAGVAVITQMEQQKRAAGTAHQ